MKNTCIGCKREISWGQKDCPFCGASQSFIRHYLKSGTIFIGLLALAGWAGHSFYEKSLVQAELVIAQKQSQQLEQSGLEVERLKIALEESNNKLQEASQSIADAQKAKSANSSKAQTLADSLQKKLTQAEKKANDQAGRAGWLSRENTRLKSELKTLKEKVALLEPTTATNAVTSQENTTNQPQPPADSDDSNSDDQSSQNR